MLTLLPHPLIQSGRDSLFVYAFNEDGTLRQLAEVPTHGNHGHEGVRHSIPSRDGGRLYVVTEHSEPSRQNKPARQQFALA